MTAILILLVLLSLWLIARKLWRPIYIGLSFIGLGVEFNPHSINLHLFNAVRELPDGDTEAVFWFGTLIEVYVPLGYWDLRWRNWRAWQIGPVAFYGPEKRL